MRSAEHIFNLRSSEQETAQRKDIKVLTMQILPGFSQNMHITHTTHTHSSNPNRATCPLENSDRKQEARTI